MTERQAYWCNCMVVNRRVSTFWAPGFEMSIEFIFNTITIPP